MTTLLEGTPSDEASAVLAIGRCVVKAMFVSMCARHPEGKDADYLRWHTFDHRPEQFRLDSVRGAIRLVSTPACRSSRAASAGRFDAVDHVMTYFFADTAAMQAFNDLAVALGGAGRIPYLLPLVERGLYGLDGMAAAPRVKVGADVLPWWPLRGAYLVVEEGSAPAGDLVNVAGVAGVWWGSGMALDPAFATADGKPISSVAGLQISFCFLDDDPVETAQRIATNLDERWKRTNVVPLLAGPFYTVTGEDCGHHLP